jgi:hypothetical protein
MTTAVPTSDEVQDVDQRTIDNLDALVEEAAARERNRVAPRLVVTVPSRKLPSDDQMELGL